MKKTILGIVLLILSACSGRVEPVLFTEVEMVLATPDGLGVRSMTVDPQLPGNKFLNLNTGRNYPYPAFADGKALLTVQKGVYTLAFDGKAEMEDGTTRTLRSYAHADPIKAVNLVSGRETLVLDVIYLY